MSNPPPLPTDGDHYAWPADRHQLEALLANIYAQEFTPEMKDAWEHLLQDLAEQRI